jgi:type III pantothenate kinase
MTLLIDIGNTSLKYTFAHKGQLSEIKRIENYTIISDYFVTHWYKAKKIILASVARRDIAETIITCAQQANINVEQIVTPRVQFGIKVAYQNYQQLGVDRWLALLGAAKTYPEQNCLIIDLGTATTIDLLRNDGQHLGGWIFPGIDTMQQSLLTNTANIQINNDRQISLLFADNTSDNVINGCLAATIGAIENAIKQAVLLVDELDHVILTGGNASLIEQNIKKTATITASHVVIMNELLFKGLQVYVTS